MKFKVFNIFCLLLILPILCISPAFGDLPPLPPPMMVIPSPPTLGAKSHLLIDYLSDVILTEENIDQRVEPASLTKMMTVYVVDQTIKAGKLKLTDNVFISEAAWKAPGSRMFLQVNTSVPLQEIMRGIIIQSGNDASVAVAEHVAGTEANFAEWMNYYAKQLGMTNTHFVNATGLPDPNHYTTARDMALLAKALIRDFPESYQLYSQKEFTYQKITQANRNRLLWRNEWVDGIKTGHTDNAGYCLVASGKKGDMRLITIIMGAKSDEARVDEANKLLMYGFRFFETRKLYPAGTSLKQARIWMGAEKEISLGLKDDLYITLGQGQYDRLKTTVNVEQQIKAPTDVGAKLGNLKVHLDDKLIIERPIVALQPVAAGGFLSRMYDRLALSLKTLWDKATQQ